ncbi:MAG: type II toxin-antitoxin system VapC family toxin [Verrucomicrobia bacterium]|nr:type II toxin-antitoxin system VapC family toxin [Verrucomicrobiota bacterium]
MIVLDTHIWVWWVNDDPALAREKKELLRANLDAGLGVSMISCWEVAKLVEKRRLALTVLVEAWLDAARASPGVYLLPLKPRIAAASTQLPQPFHNDPADQVIVATARRWDCPLATDDERILHYPHVKLAWPR